MVKSVGYLRPFLDGTNFLFGVGDNPRTLHDLAMSRLSAELRLHTNWWESYRIQAVRDKWMEDALAKQWPVGPPSNNIEIGLTRKQIEYVLDELSGYATLRTPINGAQVSCFERIWQSDILISKRTQSQLVRAVDAIRSRKPRNSSWPIVVDPFRHSLMYGRTITSAPVAPEESNDYSVSTKFASLPADVKVSDGTSNTNVQFLSYINGIEPEDNEFYVALESALASFIDLFEKVLTNLHRNNPLLQRINGSCRYTEWDEPEAPEDSDDEEAWDEHHREYELWELNRPIKIPDIPDTGYREGFHRKKFEVRLDGRQVQVIVKVTDIHLSPNDEEIAATDWHVEGMKNERIIACGDYICHMDNIHDTELEFRMAVTWPRGFLAGDVGATLRTWGIRDGDHCNQQLGSVHFKTGLAIAYPNIYQRRLSTISLKDPTKEGRLTMLSFFLVDPDAPPVVSTAIVPPQQRDWIYRALQRSLDPRLPHELIDKIMTFVDTLMSEEEADRYQLEMRDEREAFQKVNDRLYFSLPFDIWITR